MSAKWAPEMVGSKNDPKAPSQSDRNPTLIVPPSCAAVSPPSPPPSSSSPHPTPSSPSAARAATSVSSLRPLKTPLLSCPSIDSAWCGPTLGTHGGRCGRSATSPSSPSQAIANVLPDAHEAARRQQHDDQEHQPDDRVEARRA